jgi:hypothetical protein
MQKVTVISTGQEQMKLGDRSLLNHSSDDAESAYVELLLEDFSSVLVAENEPLIDNREYMRLTELKFLLKNIRELTSIQLFQSYSRSDTITYTPVTDAANLSGKSSSYVGILDAELASSNCDLSRGGTLTDRNDPANLKRASVDRQQLFKNRAKLDEILANLKSYVEKRLAIAEQLSDVAVMSADVDLETERHKGEREYRGLERRFYCQFIVQI